VNHNYQLATGLDWIQPIFALDSQLI